jgi:hypothetical protein
VLVGPSARRVPKADTKQKKYREKTTMLKRAFVAAAGALAVTALAGAIMVPPRTAAAARSTAERLFLDDPAVRDFPAPEAARKFKVAEHQSCYPKPCPTSEPKIRLKKKESGTTKFQGGANARLLKR